MQYRTIFKLASTVLVQYNRIYRGVVQVQYWTYFWKKLRVDSNIFWLYLYLECTSLAGDSEQHYCAIIISNFNIGSRRVSTIGRWGGIIHLRNWDETFTFWIFNEWQSHIRKFFFISLYYNDGDRLFCHVSDLYAIIVYAGLFYTLFLLMRGNVFLFQKRH